MLRRISWPHLKYMGPWKNLTHAAVNTLIYVNPKIAILKGIFFNNFQANIRIYRLVYFQICDTLNAIWHFVYTINKYKVPYYQISFWKPHISTYIYMTFWLWFIIIGMLCININLSEVTYINLKKKILN